MAADSTKRAKYAHRYNLNGTTDSICKECFITVVTAIWEADLERAEQKHVCESRTQRPFKRIPQAEARATVLPWRVTA